MAMEPAVPQMPVALKIDISPEILPRDTSLGTKLFVLVPSTATNVREVKTYLANWVLKTPTPFHLFMGEYRIREEEDVQILSLMTEPCRLLPVAAPKPALSSTPRVNGKDTSSTKRVTFFDGDISASPVEKCVGNNRLAVDVLDHSCSSGSSQSVKKANLHQFPSTSTPSKVSDGVIMEGEDSGSEGRKKRRRRRHRNRKSKSQSDDQSQVEDAITGISTTKANKFVSESNQNPKEEADSEEDTDDNEEDGLFSFATARTVVDESELGSSSNNEGNENRSLSILEASNEASENEGVDNKKAADQFNFVTPNASTNQRKRSSIEIHHINVKRKKATPDSAFSSPGSFLSPSLQEEPKSNGKRQDTPIVPPRPRVTRNPKIFESARKNINDFNSKADQHLTEAKQNQHEEGAFEQEQASVFINSDLTKYSASNPAKTSKSTSTAAGSLYEFLEPIESLSNINPSDKIAFKLLELDERYNPTISEFKEGIIVDKTENVLTIQYTKNEVIIRNGKYDLHSQADGSADSDHTCIGTLQFSELIQPKFVHRFSPIVATCEKAD